MDLELYGRVIWRHKLVVVIGVALAIGLAMLSVVKIGSNGIAYRQSQEWVSYQTVAVTQPGFTEGRLTGTGSNPARLALLAVLYSKYVTADAVQHAIWPQAVTGESVEAAPVLAATSGASAGPLPLISLAGFAPTPRAAQQVAARTSTALIGYITKRQAEAKVPQAQRVELQPVQRALNNAPTLFKGRTKALPIVVFLTVAIATLALAFILENLNPQIRTVSDPEEERRRHVAAGPWAS